MSDDSLDVPTPDTSSQEVKSTPPKVLEERLLVDDEQREILNALSNQMPSNTAVLWDPSATQKLPTLDSLVEKLDKPKEQISRKIDELRQLWKLPEKLPKNNRLSEDQALLLTLANQHKLRWDDEIDDYRVPRYHLYSAELGLGTLYTNTKAFEGERIVRKALGLDEMLNSVHLQGGVMPQIVSFYGKLKNNRALLTGTNEKYKDISPEKFEELFYDETADIKELLERSQGNSLSPRDIRNLRKYVINTIDSFEEAAESVAYQLVPLVEDVPKEVPIHVYYSYNDDFNLSEIETLLIEAWRKAENEANKAEKNLPKLYGDLGDVKAKLGEQHVRISLGQKIVESFNDFKERYLDGSFDFERYSLKPPQEEDEDKLPTGKKLRHILHDMYFDETQMTDEERNKFNRFKGALKGTYFRISGSKDEEGFERIFEDVISSRYLDNRQVKSLDDIVKRVAQDSESRKTYIERLEHKKDRIKEYEQLKLAREAEARSGHAWFTKQVHINPTISKAIEMAKKDRYKKYFDDILLKKLESITKTDFNIKLHTDRDISVYVPDPGQLYGLDLDDADKLYGTIITSIPRTNRQRSNEPIGNSLSELIKKHESSVKSGVMTDAQKPKKLSEFDKRTALAFSDVVFTSWGADGYNRLKKLRVSPTTVEGEYRGPVEAVNYLKLPTRHDVAALKDMALRGNTGTW
ncbi:MAG: hypothetical protein ACOCUR_01255, partial [Nanoarchaeota archaeon]